MSLLITNGKVFYGKELVDADLLIENNKIIDCGESMEADQVLDVKGNLVLPGLVDSHVHFGEPGYAHKEDFYTGSCAAAAGGVTTILDMPNSNPPVLTREALEVKRKLAAKSLVNYGFHFGGSAYNLDEIKQAKDTASVGVYLDEYYDRMIVKSPQVLEELLLSANLVSFHATGQNIKTAVNCSSELSADSYFCSINNKEDIGLLKKNPPTGTAYLEVNPHHLFLGREYEDALGAFALVHPRLNHQLDRETLWEAINSGAIATIASAHTPHTVKEKHSKNPPYGIPSVETMLPLLLNAVNDRKLSLARMVELTATNPARIFNIRSKGEIREGNDADLVVVDMKLIKRVNNQEMHSKCGWTPYQGFSLRGWPVITMVNGNIVYYYGEIYPRVRGTEVGYRK